MDKRLTPPQPSPTGEGKEYLLGRVENTIRGGWRILSGKGEK
jgi:hypothetical protein